MDTSDLQDIQDKTLEVFTDGSNGMWAVELYFNWSITDMVGQNTAGIV